MKFVSIVGARPQFIKAAPMSRALRVRHQEILVHTGQHYDDNMSGVFFRELGIPEPDHHLAIGSGPHGDQTGRMLTAIERVLLSVQPDWMIIYGDTNSTLAGALAASKLGIPIAHVEAGLRSFNRRMPEEINRVVADRLSRMLFCSSQVGADHLAREGIRDGVHVVGDVMADELHHAASRVDRETTIVTRMGLRDRGFVLATVHRAENTDDIQRLSDIIRAFSDCGEDVVLPLHPRTRKVLGDHGLKPGSRVRIIDPLGYLDLVATARSARVVLTDSGGLQKEAYWLGTPCLTLRDETEWVETVQCGWNQLVGARYERIIAALRTFAPPSVRPSLYGDGSAAEQCVALLNG